MEVDLEQGITGLANGFESRIDNLSGQINPVSSQVGAMAKEQEWLLSRELAVDMEKSSAGEVYLTLDFTLRESTRRRKSPGSLSGSRLLHPT